MVATTATPTMPAVMSPAELRLRIDRLPRMRFACLPTPMEELPKLTAALGGPRLLCKRDDLTGFAFGGNKIRGLDFLMPHVVEYGFDAFVLPNIGQSNHARLHSAACVRLGIQPVIVKPSPADEEVNGNLLLDRIVGAEIVEAHGRNEDEALDETLANLRARGLKPYVAPREPYTTIARAVAFLEGALEMQARNLRRPASRRIDASTFFWPAAPRRRGWRWPASC